jgi:hypothetical protein
VSAPPEGEPPFKIDVPSDALLYSIGLTRAMYDSVLAAAKAPPAPPRVVRLRDSLTSSRPAPSLVSPTDDELWSTHAADFAAETGLPPYVIEESLRAQQQLETPKCELRGDGERDDGDLPTLVSVSRTNWPAFGATSSVKHDVMPGNLNLGKPSRDASPSSEIIIIASEDESAPQPAPAPVAETASQALRSAARTAAPPPPPPPPSAAEIGRARQIETAREIGTSRGSCLLTGGGGVGKTYTCTLIAAETMKRAAVRREHEGVHQAAAGRTRSPPLLLSPTLLFLNPRRSILSTASPGAIPPPWTAPHTLCMP